MYYILHLLMSAGIEVELHKRAIEEEKAAVRKTSEAKEAFTTLVRGGDDEQKPVKLLENHEYLTVNEKEGIQFIMFPTSKNDIQVKDAVHHPPHELQSKSNKGKFDEMSAEKKREAFAMKQQAMLKGNTVEILDNVQSKRSN